jgi:outer membrane protein OmpA-like peptidoglycan-associated protein/tetratricopeptide (TPR) repeat protein
MKVKLSILLLLLCTIAFSQQKLKKANRLFDEMAYVEAAEAYEEYFEKAKSEKPQGTSLLNLADAYYFTRNYSKASKWYGKAELDDVRFNRYVQSLRIQKKYDEADRLMQQRMGNDAQKLQRFNRQKLYLDSITKLPPAFTVTNVASVNTDKSDFCTAFYGTQVVFSSSKDTMKIGGKTYKYNMQPYLELYIADRNEGDGMLINQKKFVAKNQIDYHNAVVAFSPDMHTMYYSANTVRPSGKLNNSKGGTNNLGVFYGLVEVDNLREVKPLPSNSLEYSVAHPALTEDGRWLYFVSDMPGGYGETDIYKVEVMADGTFGQPQNLGPVVNTPHKEMFPFVQGNVLYFSSKGHYGLGGLDVFKSKITADSYGEPENMGMPINSNLDDFALVFSADGSYGYLSSNRDGGRGDDDIYYFTRKEECKQSVSGVVLHKKIKTPLKGAKITAVGADGKFIASAEADNDGYYTFILPCDAVVIIQASEEDYTAEKAEVVTAKEPEQRKVDFELTKYDDLVIKQGEVEKVAINPIYFDLDKYDITKQAVIELDKVVYVMKNFPGIIIKIESHTDSRASDEYNITLSQNRARATYQYIISKGIDASRIESVTGYGETRLLNGCSNDVPCSEEEHQLNRRSEFIIVRK